jgi:tRNA(Arg) A34 adenosine deaminase TadA
MRIPWIELAIREAKKSTYKTGNNIPVQVGAVVFNKKRYISSGHNYGCRSLSKSHNPIYRKFSHSVHAEIDAIIRAHTNLSGASILVIRLNRKGELRLAKPCEHCMAYIEHVGIRNIFYSTSVSSTIEHLTI